MNLTPLYAILIKLHARGADVFSYHVMAAAIPRKDELITCGYRLPEPLRGTFRVVEVVHLWPQDDLDGGLGEAQVEVHVQKYEQP